MYIRGNARAHRMVGYDINVSTSWQPTLPWPKMIAGHVWSTQHGVCSCRWKHFVCRTIWVIHLLVEHTKASLEQLRRDVLPERPPTVLNFTHRPLVLKFTGEREDADISILRVRPRLILQIDIERLLRFRVFTSPSQCPWPVWTCYYMVSEASTHLTLAIFCQSYSFTLAIRLLYHVCLRLFGD